ncbi:S-adenosylmethionine synthetase [Platysternon megacephalum]|uniref:S-adenosylmethionine synthetase n=1 Tax=Platysternon megacephalum TaxID=55544 RepID=A0A4D9DFW6_9SAUR|nr:S-adenosylmethionine synthetase [Platysternon megacephalum]
MTLQKLQEVEGGNGTREEGEEREEEPDPEQQDENITLSSSQGAGRAWKSDPLWMSEPSESPRRKAVRSGTETPLKPHSQSLEPYDCWLPLLHSAQRIQTKDGRGEAGANLTPFPPTAVARPRRDNTQG